MQTTASIEKMLAARFPHASSVNVLDAGSGWFKATVVIEGDSVTIVDSYEVFVKMKRTQTKILER